MINVGVLDFWAFTGAVKF